MTEQTKYVAVCAGCAECGDSPLMEIEGFYESLDAAIKDYENYRSSSSWEKHPQGGYHKQGSSSGVWLIPMSKFKQLEEKNEDLELESNTIRVLGEVSPMNKAGYDNLGNPLKEKND